MKINEDIRPVTYLKSRAADLLAQVNETHPQGGFIKELDAAPINGYRTSGRLAFSDQVEEKLA